MHRCSLEQRCRESTEKPIAVNQQIRSLLLDQPQYCQVSIDNNYTVKRLRTFTTREEEQKDEEEFKSTRLYDISKRQ